MIPTPLPPAQLLNQLQQRIATEVNEGWLFPQRRAVSGFPGTGPIVLVGWRRRSVPFLTMVQIGFSTISHGIWA
jgi:hypothetical protein